MQLIQAILLAVCGSQFSVEVTPTFSVEVAQEAKVQSEQPQVSKPKKYLAMFTASYCGPCQYDKKNVVPRILNSGHYVKIVEMTNGDSSLKYSKRIRSYPSYVVCDWATGEWLSDVHVGQIDLATAKRMLEGNAENPEQKVETSRQLVNPPSRYIRWSNGERIDLETYSRNCNCSMCQGIRALQRQYRAGQYQTMSYEPEYNEDLPPGQQPTPESVVTEMISLMQLRPDDVLADFGCGHDARILIEAVRQAGCRGIGIEIDPEAAESARRSVADAGLSGSIRIIQGDALEFDLERHFSTEVQDGWQVTAITAYLYEDLLKQLAPKMRSVRVSASPFHQAFAGQIRHGDVWIWRR